VTKVVTVFVTISLKDVWKIDYQGREANNGKHKTSVLMVSLV
jgi:hypothetical protein